LKKVLLLDANNLIYRARYSAKYAREGDAAIIYSFFRSLRPLIEKFDPDTCYFVRDGAPVDRLDILPEYKGNRIREHDENFFSQKREIENLVNSFFPIMVCRDLNLEADDLIAYLVLETHKEDECVIVSSDTDFIQLLQEHPNCELYNPITKKMREAPDYDYLTWKSLRGDGSDNISGIPRVGDKTAEKLARDLNELSGFLDREKSNREIYERNRSLIKFRRPKNISEVFMGGIDSDFEKVKEKFIELNFHSMTKEKAWQKYRKTFERILNESCTK
jgi:DNA polymerase-1